MDLGTGQVSAVLCELHPAVSAASIAARLKYFQRRGFPPSDIVIGTGGRAQYGPCDVLKITYAFELLAAFIPPEQALDLVGDSWSGLEDTVKASWKERATREFGLFIRVKGVGVSAKGSTSGTLTAETADQLRRWQQGSGPDRAVVVLDAVRIARDLSKAIVEVVPKDRIERVGASFARWAAE